MSKSGKSSIIGWYTSEIQNIMHGFGDSSRPMAESAFLIEDIVHQQMSQLLAEANNIAYSRGTKIIGLEEMMFLMRKDKVKLARLLRYLSIKDLKAKAKFNPIDDNSEEIKASNFLRSSNKSSTSSQSNLLSSKRIKLCYEFISSIDHTGDLLSAFNEDFFDETKHRRNLRMDRMTFNMTESQYLRYSEARQATFANKAKPKRFKEWLLKDDTQDIKLNPYAWEIFQYLAYETVAEIIDIAFLVKQDREVQDNDPVAGLIPLKMRNPDYPDIFTVPIVNTNSNQKNNNLLNCEESNIVEDETLASDQPAKRLKTIPNEPLVTSNGCITPCDIREAIRRFNQAKGVFSIMEKCYNRPRKMISL